MAKIKHVVGTEKNAVLPLPPIAFPISLPHGVTVNLASLTFDCHNLDAAILQAVVNWSATFTPPSTASVLTTPGYADVAFELLLNGDVIYRVIQTATQKGIPIIGNFITATTTYQIASLLHFAIPVYGHERNNYTLRATNIVLTAPVLAAGLATTTAAAGAVTLVAKELDC